MPGPTCAWSACTRWAWGSSRARSFTFRAISSIPHTFPRALTCAQASHDLDILHVLIDVSARQISGYQASDWLREHRAVDLGLSDHRRVEPVQVRRDAFFGPAESVPADQAVGRVTAERVTPYPPGIPALIPGERITRAIVDYLRSGVRAGTVLPDATDSSLDTIRVTALP